MNAEDRSVISDCCALAALLVAAAAAPLAAQTPAEIQAALDAAYAKYKDFKEGANADYIPALAKVDSKIYGIALVTTDGKVYTAGDVRSEVSIQSISKVFTMAKVMDEQGTDAILNRIGADATGMRFNSIVSIEWSQKGLGGPEMNALVNPGAITATSMVKGETREEIWKSDPRLLLRLRRPAARGQQGGLRLGGRHQPAQPGDRLPDTTPTATSRQSRCGRPTSTPSSARSASTPRIWR